MNSFKWAAIAIILASLVIGSTFGLIASSNPTRNRNIMVTADIVSSDMPTSCHGIPADFTNWVQLHVHANQTGLNLVSLTALTPLPSISITISLNDSSSLYVYYHHYNETYEMVTVPIPNYWKPGQDVDLSVNYYYSGLNPTPPTDYTIGAVLVNSTTLSC